MGKVWARPGDVSVKPCQAEQDCAEEAQIFSKPGAAAGGGTLPSIHTTSASPKPQI